MHCVELIQEHFQAALSNCCEEGERACANMQGNICLAVVPRSNIIYTYHNINARPHLKLKSSVFAKSCSLKYSLTYDAQDQSFPILRNTTPSGFEDVRQQIPLQLLPIPMSNHLLFHGSSQEDN